MEELFDLCDENGNLLGVTETRSRVHAQGLWHKSAQVWILDSQNRLLLQRRDPSKQTDPGKWDISVAGHVSAGQSVLEAALRETHEELGLVLSPSELVMVFSVRREYLQPETGFLDREIHHNFLCRRDVNLSELVLQPGEVVEVAWQDLRAFQLRVEGDDPTLVGRPREYTQMFSFLGLPPVN
ncbi:MAG: NUDIX domain-containing protein [Spirochaetales bacterium]|nr:NUDIX domain-containing protein [Spirochaetales bacterium]